MGSIISRACDCMIGQVRTAMMRDESYVLFSSCRGGARILILHTRISCVYHAYTMHIACCPLSGLATRLPLDLATWPCYCSHCYIALPYTRPIALPRLSCAQ